MYRLFALVVGAFMLGLGPAHAEIDLQPLDEPLARYEQQLAERASQDSRPAADLLRAASDARRDGKTAAEIDVLEVLAGRAQASDEAGFSTWLSLALAQSKQAYCADVVSEASLAAYKAYKRASSDTERIEALAILGYLLRRAAGFRHDTSDEESEFGSEDCTLNIVDDSHRSTRGEAENRQGARNLAYEVFTELGKLAADSRYAETAEALKGEFKLDSVTYPPPAGIDCSGYQTMLEQSAELEQAGDSQAKPAEAAEGETAESPETNTTADAEADETTSTDDQDEDKTAEQNDAPYCQDAQDPERPERNACLVFSDHVGSTADDISAAVQVRPKKGEAVSAYPALIKDKQVCYSLDFGREYEIKIEKPELLKSAGGVPVQPSPVRELNMPDKLPLLGFKRGTYVLPAKADRMLAMNTVNVAEAKIMLRRIGDRNLVREIVVNHILGGFGKADEDAARGGACFILNRVGERIADGSVKLDTSGVSKNQEVPFVVPIGTILDRRQDWLEGNSSDDGLSQPADNGKLDLTFSRDDAAEKFRMSRNAGVFALFGQIVKDRLKGSMGEPYSDDDDDVSCPPTLTAQWFVVTDIGLTVQRSHSELHVIARSLDTGDAVAGANVELVSAGGLVLAAAKTDEVGMAKFPGALARGKAGNKLAAVMVDKDRDFAFLDMTAPTIDLSDRGLDGSLQRTAGDIDAFVAPVRGMYRPGDTLEALILLRDLNGQALPALPPFEVALISANGVPLAPPRTIAPKGRSASEHASAQASHGAYRFSARISETARRGKARIVVKVGGLEAGTAEIAIRDFEPYTLRITNKQETWSGTIDENNVLRLSGEARADFLYGRKEGSEGTDAPARGLKVAYDVRIAPAETPLEGCFEGYSFGLPPSNYTPQLIRGTEIDTDKDGRIAISLPPAEVAPASMPLKAEVTIAVLEANAVADKYSFDVPLVQSGQIWIGAKALRPSIWAASHDPAKTELAVAALDATGKPIEQDVKTTIVRNRTTFIWQRDGTSGDYVPDASKGEELDRVTKTIKAGQSEDGCPAPTEFDVSLPEIGSYTLQLKAGKAATELRVGRGWTTAKDGSLLPDRLEVRADKPNFNRGEAITIAVGAPYASARMVVQFFSRGVQVDAFESEIKQGKGEVKVEVGENWPKGAMHVYVTALSPGAGANHRGPARAIGGMLIRIEVEANPTVSILAGEKFSLAQLNDSSAKSLPVTVRTQGLDQDAFVVLAAVDAGVLRIANDRTPDPVQHYFGGRALGFDVHDTYGRILTVGGDDIAPLRRGLAYEPTELLSWLSNIERVGEDGSVKFNIGDRIPQNFQGEVTLMAWAFDARGIAVTDGETKIRDAIAVRISTPRLMSPGDKVLLPLRVSALAAAGQVPIEVRIKAPLRFADDIAGASPGSDCADEPADACRRYAIDVQADGTEVELVPLSAGDVASVAGQDSQIELSYKLPGTDLHPRTVWPVRVRMPTPPLAQALASASIPPGGSFTLDESALEAAGGVSFDLDSTEITARLAVVDLSPTNGKAAGQKEVYPLEALAHEMQLLLADRWITSVSAGAALEQDPAVERLTELAYALLPLQDDEGAFLLDVAPGLMFAELNASEGAFRGRPRERFVDSVETTAFALDSLGRARAAGAAVDNQALSRAADYLRRNLPYYDECTRSHIYALIALARLDQIDSRKFRRTAHTCAALAKTDEISRLMLAAAYRAFGYREEAQLLPAVDIAALRKSGKAPIEVARALALLLENDPPDAEAKLIKISHGPAQPLDMAVESWLARAQAALLLLRKQEAATFARDRVSITPTTIETRAFPYGLDLQRLTVDEFPIKIVNSGDTALNLGLFAEGLAEKKAEGGNGYSVKLRLYGRDGAIEEDQGTIHVKQFETVYCALEIQQTDASYAAPQRPAAVQTLPTGFEVVDETHEEGWPAVIGKVIDPDALSSLDYVETNAGSWIALPEAQPNGDNSRIMHVLAFSMRPTMQGQFALPPLVVRDLNNPARDGWTKPSRIEVQPSASPN